MCGYLRISHAYVLNEAGMICMSMIVILYTGCQTAGSQQKICRESADSRAHAGTNEVRHKP